MVASSQTDWSFVMYTNQLNDIILESENNVLIGIHEALWQCHIFIMKRCNTFYCYSLLQCYMHATM